MPQYYKCIKEKGKESGDCKPHMRAYRCRQRDAQQRDPAQGLGPPALPATAASLHATRMTPDVGFRDSAATPTGRSAPMSGSPSGRSAARTAPGALLPGGAAVARVSPPTLSKGCRCRHDRAVVLALCRWGKY